VGAELIGKEYPRRGGDHAGQCRQTATK
jgi:hypothetical protein